MLTSLMLIPDQPAAVLAAECALVGVLLLVAPLRFQLDAYLLETPNDQAQAADVGRC